jgi:hypothetical protein
MAFDRLASRKGALRLAALGGAEGAEGEAPEPAAEGGEAE